MSTYPGLKRRNPKNRVDYNKSISGYYGALQKGQKLELKLDVDQHGPFNKALNMVSGTLVVEKRAGRASAAYFRSNLGGTEVTSQPDGTHVTAGVHIMFSDGGMSAGKVETVVHNGPKMDVTVTVESETFHFSEISRKSKHFRDVQIDIDFVKDFSLPILDMEIYTAGLRGQLKTTLDLFSVFEQAGLKLNYDYTDTRKVEDPTPDTPWTKGDVYAVMEENFLQTGFNDDHIWCLMASRSPNPQNMGYAIDNNGQRGFAMFLEHSSFAGITSYNKKVKKNSLRRFLHYLAHECGAALGLDPVEGNPSSLSWMNYAWKYDSVYGAGTYYDSFDYSYSDEELAILRHQPDKTFKTAYQGEAGSSYEYGPATKSTAPDYGSDDDYDYAPPKKQQKTRKVNFDIKFRPVPYQKGDVVEFEATMKNVGKLPSKIEPVFEPGAGNLTVYVTDPDGEVQKIKPLVRTIDPPTRRYVVLGKPGSREYSDQYSEVVPLVQSSKGPVFKKKGSYTVKAVYESYNLKLTSASQYVSVEDDTDEDEATKYEITKAVTLENSSSYGKQSNVLKYWNKLAHKPVEEKKKSVQMMIPLMEGYASDALKVKGKGAEMKIGLEKSPLSYQKLIDDTQDMVEYYHGNPTEDTLNYNKLVYTRAQVLIKDNKPQKADSEYAEMVTALVKSDSDFGIIKRVVEQWKKLLKRDNRTEPVKFQERFEKLFNWRPSGPIDNDEDASGLGLASYFSNFDDDHKAKAKVFIKDLERLEDNTNDLNAVLDYAEARQQSFEVNHDLYKWAIESYIVHSDLAKSDHIKYPEPPKIPKPPTIPPPPPPPTTPTPTPSSAVSVMTPPKKLEVIRPPQESRMNYFRNDGHFNFHHKHWHAVYGGNHRRPKRQGELFVYLHAQMLARYDAERESWGLDPVQPYEYAEVESDGYDAGKELNEDYRMNPRPPGLSWTEDDQSKFKMYEDKLVNLFQTEDAVIETENADSELKLSPNLAGHILEATSGEFTANYFSLHNRGHMAFYKIVGSTYMIDPATAARDPVFFRWHKHVDNIAQTYFDNCETELGEENPGVVVEPSDVLVLPGRETPKGFDQWKGGKWAQKNFQCADINTFLKEPEMKHEVDNKLDHEPFSFHVRLRRKSGEKGELPVTLRLFICPEKHVDDRRRWIEMDKFVHVMKANEDHAVLKRFDVHSSVIKRLHEDWVNVEETKHVKNTVAGNCECGWPYNMMLPRGRKECENWCLGLFVSNNKVDQINEVATCGSMSYCGTTSSAYPDQRTMGFPFSTPITIKDTVVKITEAAKKLDNFCITPFKIVNNIEHEIPNPEDIVWAPYNMFGNTGKGHYSASRTFGRYRVVLDDVDFRVMGADRIRIKLHGRPEGHGGYALSGAKLALRLGNSLKVDEKVNVPVTFNGRTEVEVPEEGIVSDEVSLSVPTGTGRDYFLTFTLISPGCSALGKSGSTINTYMLTGKNASGENGVTDDWDSIPKNLVRELRSIYCVESALLA